MPSVFFKRLAVATSDGVITAGERQMLLDFKTRHGIGDDAHAEMLAELGWTAAQFGDTSASKQR